MCVTGGRMYVTAVKTAATEGTIIAAAEGLKVLVRGF
jgi:hypothetical protein